MSGDGERRPAGGCPSQPWSVAADRFCGNPAGVHNACPVTAKTSGQVAPPLPRLSSAPGNLPAAPVAANPATAGCLWQRRMLSTRLAASIVQGCLPHSLPSQPALSSECASCNKLCFFISFFDTHSDDETSANLSQSVRPALYLSLIDCIPDQRRNGSTLCADSVACSQNNSSMQCTRVHRSRPAATPAQPQWNTYIGNHGETLHM